MNLLLLAMPLLLPQSFQDSDTGDLRFTRVHLRNGNFIDGQVVKDSVGSVLLRIRSGEIDIRRDQIDKVELVKMKSYGDRSIFFDKPKAPDKGPVAMPDKGPIKTPEVNTPEAIRKKVDMILFRYKQMRKNANDVLPVDQIQALGEEAVVYLASSAPLFDLQ